MTKTPYAPDATATALDLTRSSHPDDRSDGALSQTSHPARESLDGIAFRAAPHNIDAEQELLGALLINNECYERISGLLEAQHFFDPLHAQIFETAEKLIRAGKIASPVTLRTFFENAEPVDENLTVPQYMGRLAASATGIINVYDYARTVQELAIRRMLIVIGEDVANTAYDSPVDLPPNQQILEAETALFNLAESGKYGKDFESFDTALTAALDMANNAFKVQGGLSGLSTGLVDLDSRLGGLQNSDLIILAGRPSMGKTALVTNIAFNVANAYSDKVREDGTVDSTCGGIVGFFSLEMSAEQLATRILAEQAEISSEKIRRGLIDQDEFDRLAAATQRLAQIPLYIDETGGITVAQLAARARKLKRQRGLDLVIIDYLQLLAGSKRGGESRVQEITEITTSLKALAKELQVPIIALSQLSRAVEQREDKRPQLSDLRESGSIEQDADVVMFVFREEYYIERAKPSEGTEQFFKWQDEMVRVSGKAEAIIGKQRHGAVGTVVLGFEGRYTRFFDLAASDRVPERHRE
ncbi:MAG: replicative DNA helicase [Pseudomonadota bacterium]